MAIAAGIAAFVLLPSTIAFNLRAAIAWDAFALVYLALAFALMMTSTSEALRQRAAKQDDSRVVILAIILLVIAASFLAIAGVLGEARQVEEKFLPVTFATASLCLSWTVTQVVFTLHYAHEYYSPDEGPERLREGLHFPDTGKPDYWDFFYFATSFGARTNLGRVDTHQGTAQASHASCSDFIFLQRGRSGGRRKYRSQPVLSSAANQPRVRTSAVWGKPGTEEKAVAFRFARLDVENLAATANWQRLNPMPPPLEWHPAGTAR